jgi:hypothetical protein
MIFQSKTGCIALQYVQHEIKMYDKAKDSHNPGSTLLQFPNSKPNRFIFTIFA